jgi:hypothetical protein
MGERWNGKGRACAGQFCGTVFVDWAAILILHQSATSPHTPKHHLHNNSGKSKAEIWMETYDSRIIALIQRRIQLPQIIARGMGIFPRAVWRTFMGVVPRPAVKVSSGVRMRSKQEG